jgi:hypothetical protein
MDKIKVHDKRNLPALILIANFALPAKADAINEMRLFGIVWHFPLDLFPIMYKREPGAILPWLVLELYA